MNWKLFLGGWVILCASIIYLEVNKYRDTPAQLSECHNAEIRIYYDKPMCTECKLFCEVKK